jgi:DNA-binding GntR family transcriptional regulator
MIEGLPRIDPLRETPAREAAYQVLRSAILDGRLGSGERLVERDLADALGISRTPVREALQKLEQERLIRKTPRRGMVVAGFSERDVNEIYLIRSALEALATELASQRCTEEQVLVLEELQHAMQACLAAREMERYLVVHSRFHQLIWQAAGSSLLIAMLSQLRESVARFVNFAYTVPGHVDRVAVEHQAIVVAIRSRNPEAAAAAARHHVQMSHKTVLGAISREMRKEEA